MNELILSCLIARKIRKVAFLGMSQTDYNKQGREEAAKYGQSRLEDITQHGSWNKFLQERYGSDLSGIGSSYPEGIGQKDFTDFQGWNARRAAAGQATDSIGKMNQQAPSKPTAMQTPPAAPAPVPAVSTAVAKVASLLKLAAGRKDRKGFTLVGKQEAQPSAPSSPAAKPAPAPAPVAPAPEQSPYQASAAQVRASEAARQAQMQRLGVSMPSQATLTPEQRQIIQNVRNRNVAEASQGSPSAAPWTEQIPMKEHSPSEPNADIFNRQNAVMANTVADKMQATHGGAMPEEAAMKGLQELERIKAIRAEAEASKQKFLARQERNRQLGHVGEVPGERPVITKEQKMAQRPILQERSSAPVMAAAKAPSTGNATADAAVSKADELLARYYPKHKVKS